MDYVDFGRYLTQQRELRGLSRHDVVKATRIPASIIAALEDGQVERLPARVFVLNYIRAYAGTIGLAAEEALLRFEEIDRTQQATPPPQALERQRKTKATLILVAVLVLTALGGWGAFMMWGRPRRPLEH
ncbi:MAG TPA: helix-turn-helix domain-containing protein [Myxococcaceae bacterium]|nr:helix-turn-helix domain-containing protein [Myxococcaceae bacterium]